MKILEIIPYEKIVQINSMFLTLENDVFLEKSEFYSDLKQKAVSRLFLQFQKYIEDICKKECFSSSFDLENKKFLTVDKIRILSIKFIYSQKQLCPFNL